MTYVPGAPRIEGLKFRRFAGVADYSAMSSVGRKSFKADKIDYFETAEDIANDFKEWPGRNPHTDILFAEIGGELVAYGRIWSDPGAEKERVFWHVVHVVPERRNTDLRLALLRFNEAQIISMAEGQGLTGPRTCKVWALDEPNDWRDLIHAEGYRPVMHFYEMVRPNLDHIPTAPLPEGLALRPAKPEDYLKIWTASKEAFRGKPWFVEAYYDREFYDAWLNSSTFQPDLWAVAWDGDEVAGMARNEIPVDENRELKRNRGHTQHLSVMPKWRRKGLGRALLAESLKMMRERGLDEASLDVETQNTTGEVQLYLSVGYAINRNYAHFIKRLTKTD